MLALGLSFLVWMRLSPHTGTPTDGDTEAADDERRPAH